MEAELAVPSQAKLKKWTRLNDNKFRRKEGLFLVEGIKVVEELLTSHWRVSALLFLAGKRKYLEKITLKIPADIPRYEVTRCQWQKISQDKEPEGLMAVAVMLQEPFLADFLDRASGNVLILHEINNPGNLGAIMRSALWFGFYNVILSTGSVEHTHPKVVRTSMGSLFKLNILSNMQLEKILPEMKKSYYLVGSNVYRGGRPHLPERKIALILGSESHGLREEILDMMEEQWSIPGSGKIDSLSLPQAAAIMMYECTKNESAINMPCLRSWKKLRPIY
jgi:TrmH family RNA methyltransferase